MSRSAGHLCRANSFRPSIEILSGALRSLAPWGANAAMIGCQGFYEYQAGHLAGRDLNAYATRDISLG